MTEQEEILDEKVAYQIAMDNLEPTCSNPYPLRTEYPGRYFHHGEEGRGLVIAPTFGIVYLSGPYIETLIAVEGEIVIGQDLYLENPQYRSLDGRLPIEAIGEVIDFTSQVKATIETHHNQISQR